jgi:branched-chain amino acid transport system substrate-binding protein
MAKNQRGNELTRRTFIKLASGGVIAVSGNWFLPKFSWGAGDEIRIGGVFELSGGLSTIGVEQAKGAELAVKQINETGGVVSRKPGVLGRPVKLLMEDTESKVGTGLAKAKKLIEREKVHVLNGIIMSSISMAIQGYVKEKKIPFLNSGSGNEEIVNPPHCGRYFFKGTFGNPQIVLPVQYGAKKHGGRWYFIADNYSWGYNCTKFFKQAIQRVVKLDVAGEDYPPFNCDNYAPYITKIQAANADGVAIGVCGGGYARFIKQARQMGLKTFFHHNFYSRPDVKAAGDASLGMMSGTNFLIENPKIPRAMKFAEEFKAFTGDYPGGAGADGYNGIEVICKAIQEAGSTEPEKIVDALENLVFKDSVETLTYQFRKCDHMATFAVYTVEVVKDAKYQYNSKLIEIAQDPDQLMIPCGKTGCEESMKKS